MFLLWGTTWNKGLWPEPNHILYDRALTQRLLECFSVLKYAEMNVIPLYNVFMFTKFPYCSVVKQIKCDI